jgi:hypothetical protein
MPQPRGCHGRRRSLRASAGRAAGAAALIAGVLIAGVPASAQTLTEAFAYAYNNNPQLLAQRAALRAADERTPLRDLLALDPEVARRLSLAELDATFDDAAFLRHVPTVIARLDSLEAEIHAAR